MRRLTELLLCAWMLSFPAWGLAAEAEQLPLGLIDYSQSNSHLTVTRGTPEVTSIALEVPEIVAEQHLIDFKSYTAFGIPGEPLLFSEGEPTVPHVTRYYRIPNQGGVDLVVTAAEFELLEGVDVLPFLSEPGAFNSLDRKESVYSADAWFPADVAQMSDPVILRDFRLVTVSLFPVQVNPVTRQVRLYHNLQVDIVANGQPGENELVWNHPVSQTFAPIYRDIVANLDESALDEITDRPGIYLILCHTDVLSRKWADSLFEWKTRIGFPVRIEARNNWTKQSVVQFVQTAYQTWPNPPEFICLIGDPDWTPYGIPSESYGAYDHDYARGNNNDQIPDMAVGRLSGNSAQMAVINAKIMGYERNPYLGDTLWYRRGFFYGDVGHSIASNYTLMQWGAQMFRNYTGVHNGVVEYSNNDADENRVRYWFQQGISYFFWRGSYLSQMDNGVASSTQPGWKLPVCMLITCGANEFVNGTGTAELFLQAGSTTQPQGGIASAGTSTSGTHNPPNITLAGGLMYGIANVGEDQLGPAFLYSKLWLFKTFVNQVSMATDFCRYFNLMGDPGLHMWTDVPVVMECSHPATINVGTRQVAIEVARDDNGVPIADAMVTLWKRGADSTYSIGRTDAEGRITLPVAINATGNLMLTVYKKNHKPYLYNINCVQAEQMAMLSSLTLDDDNAGGTSGNGDGILNPGETIDLPIYVKNFGSSGTVTSISATLASGNPRVTVTQNSATYPNLAPGDSALGSQAFRITVSPTMQYQETVLLTLTVNSSMGQTPGSVELECISGAVSYASHTVQGGAFDPGTTRTLQVTVRNHGTEPLTSVTGQLVSLSPFVMVDDPTGTFGNIAASGTASNSGDLFTVSSNSLTFRGHQAPMMVITTAAGGLTDTARFTLNVGTALATDPTGPDAYGYYAYDNTDVSYEMHPTYEYVNITGGLGTNLNLNDVGEKNQISQLWSTARRLPFAFKYYGVVYDTVTICSNGWIAFGNQAWNDNFRNFPIPAMVAPEAMIAPYWDDLKTSGSGLGVWHWHDEANGRYVVQWKAQGAFDSRSLDFQVILYDTTLYPTLDGNGKIQMQYNQVVLNLSTEGYEPTNGCTIGIQAPRGLVGLEYLYGSTYRSGAAAMATGRAILFTTAAREMFGTITGVVRDAATNLPKSDAHITVDGYSYHADCNAQGQYTIPNVLIGNYTVRASAYRFNDATMQDVVVALDSTSTADFNLLHPEMTLSRDTIFADAYDDPIVESFDIVNDGNGPLDYSIQVFYAGDENPNPWDPISGIQLSQATGDYQIMGCEFVGDYWWVTGGGGVGGQNMLYKFDIQGNLAASIPQPSTTDFGWFDLAYDGTYIYGSDGPNIVGIDEDGVVRRTIPSPMNPTRAIAFDPALRHFWVTDYTHDIFEIDTLGNILQQIENRGTGELAITGLAWNPTDANGYKLYVFSQNGTSSFVRVTRMHPLSHVRETVIDLAGEPGDRAGGCTITPGWNSALLVFGAIMQNSAGDRLGIYEISFNTTWINVTPAEFSVPGGGSRRVNIAMDPEMLRPDLYRVDLRIASVVYDTTMVLPVALTVNSSSADDAIPEALPTEYALQQNYPNPFNPVTTIGYELRDPGHTKLTVYNLLGEQVAVLLNDFQSAGRYQIAFDATRLPSGMYFYRLESGSFKQTHKMVLMK